MGMGNTVIVTITNMILITIILITTILITIILITIILITIILITVFAMEMVIIFAGDEVDEGEGEGEGGGRKKPLLPQIEILEPTSYRYV